MDTKIGFAPLLNESFPGNHMGQRAPDCGENECHSSVEQRALIRLVLINPSLHSKVDVEYRE